MTRGQGKPSPPSGPGRESEILGETGRRYIERRCLGRHVAIGTAKVDAAAQPKAAAAGGSRRLRSAGARLIFIPSGDGRKEWQRLFDAASKVEIVAIVNPNSGPGDERNADYAAIFTEASQPGHQARGLREHGLRQTPPGGDQARTSIHGSGFILRFAGFSSTSSLAKVVTRRSSPSSRDYVKRKLRDPLVITNPGIPCDEAYLAQAVSNVTCVFVNYQGFDRFELPRRSRLTTPLASLRCPTTSPTPKPCGP